MNNFIWVGSIVRGRGNRIGMVISLNKKNDFACIRGYNGYWSDNVSSLRVISNKEVR